MYTWDLVRALESASPASYKVSVTLILSAQTINEDKIINPEMRSNFQQIVLYCLGLCSQNPGLKEDDLEPSPERGHGKINMQKQGRKKHSKESKSYHTAWTHIWIVALRLHLKHSG